MAEQLPVHNGVLTIGVENSPQIASFVSVKASPVGSASPQLSPELLELKNRHTIRLMLCLFLMVALGYSIHCCYSLIFFYLEHGHSISEGFLQWLCGVTVAQIAVMLGVFVRAVWAQNDKKPKR